MPLTQTQLIDGYLSLMGTPANPVPVQLYPVPPTLQAVTATDAAAGDTTIEPAVPGKRIKVYAVSATAPSNTVAITATFTDAAGGPPLFSVLIQAPNQASYTFGTAVNPPSFLFATSPGNALNLNLSAAGVQVSTNVSYWVE